MDTVDREKIVEYIDTYRKVYDFAEIIPASALRAKNLDTVIDMIFKYLPYGPQFYDEDTVTDQPERQLLLRRSSVRRHCMRSMMRFRMESPFTSTG